jgi:hypothetical protein
MPKRESKTKAEAQPKPQKLTATAVELHVLAPIQQLMCDLVSDMLINGGDPRLTDQLIIILNKHKWWLWALQVHGREATEKIAAAVKEAPGRYQFNEWREDLHAAWRETRKAPPAERPVPSSAIERIRFSMIERLREQFESFLIGGTPEEQWTLWDTLVTHENGNRGRDNFQEFPLAGAFEAALGQVEHDWIKVPQSLRKTVLSYLECLEEASRPCSICNCPAKGCVVSTPA